MKRLALVLGATGMLGVVPAGAQAGRLPACHPSGTVLLRQHGVVVWDTGGNVYVCASRSYQRRKLASGASNPAVSGSQFAGHYVGFFLTTNVEVYWRYLVVFNRQRGLVEVKDLTSCQGNDECGSDTPVLGRFWLSRDGWVAERWDSITNSTRGSTPGSGLPGSALLATRGAEHHYQLDVARISNVTLRDYVLHWHSDLGGASSVRLGNAVVTPASPKTLSACQLLSARDLEPVLGASSSSGSSGSCTYTSTGASGRTLSLDVRTGLTATEVRSRENALSSAGWGDYTCCEIVGWPADVLPWDMDNQVTEVGVWRDQWAGFVHGAEVELDLALPNASITQANEGTTQAAHLGTVALDRLFGVNITRQY